MRITKASGIKIIQTFRPGAGGFHLRRPVAVLALLLLSPFCRGASTAPGGTDGGVDVVPETAEVPYGNSTELDADSLEVSLGELDVVATRRQTTPQADAPGIVRLDASLLRSAPRQLGEADMLHLFKLLPGVNTSSDYSSGMSVDGSDYSQNLYRLNSVPVIFPYHFGGMFSTFNSFLFTQASLRRYETGDSHVPVVGSMVDLTSPAKIGRHVRAEANLGLTATSLSGEIPVIPGALSIGAGARVSYISQIYGPMLGGRNTNIKYDFYDLDLAPRWKKGTHTLEGTLHYNSDLLQYEETRYVMTTGMRWSNLASGITWRHCRPDTAFSSTLTAYYSAVKNHLKVDITNVLVDIPSSATQAAVTFDTETRLSRTLHLLAGIDATFFASTPQYANTEGFGNAAGIAPPTTYEALLCRVNAALMWRMSHKFSARLALNADKYAIRHTSFPVLLSPQGQLTYTPARGISLAVASGVSRQYFHYIGQSEIGMASNFRLLANRQLPPQKAWFAYAEAKWSPAAFPLGLQAAAYYKRITNSAEYVGNIVDMLSQSYDAYDYANLTRGYNVGFSVMAMRTSGRLTGWASYAWGIARRRSYTSPEWFTAVNEIRNSLKVSANFALTRHWNLGGTFNYSTGHPYTPVESLYILGNRLIMQYGKRNSANFPPYHRLDIFANYRFSTHRHLPLTHTVSLSLLNVYGRNNIEMQSYLYSTETGHYRLHRVGSLFRFLPSISYTITL